MSRFNTRDRSVGHSGERNHRTIAPQWGRMHEQIQALDDWNAQKEVRLTVQNAPDAPPFQAVLMFDSPTSGLPRVQFDYGRCFESVARKVLKLPGLSRVEKEFSSPRHFLPFGAKKIWSAAGEAEMADYAKKHGGKSMLICANRINASVRLWGRSVEAPYLEELLEYAGLNGEEQFLDCWRHLAFAAEEYPLERWGSRETSWRWVEIRTRTGNALPERAREAVLRALEKWDDSSYGDAARNEAAGELLRRECMEAIERFGENK